jgi:hypothetical protein
LNGDVKTATCCGGKADDNGKKVTADEIKASCDNTKVACDNAMTECCERTDCCEKTDRCEKEAEAEADEKTDANKIDTNGNKVNGTGSTETANEAANRPNGDRKECQFLTDGLKVPSLSVDQLFAEHSVSVVQINSDRKMRVLLVQTAQGLSPSSGGYKANYCFLVQLAKSGHECAQICYAFESEINRVVAGLEKKGKDAQLKRERVHVTDRLNRLQCFDVTLFYNDDGILNIALDRTVFNVVWPTALFFPGIIEFLEVMSALCHSLPPLPHGPS